MPDEQTIPALPCASMKETLEFYVALGFEITYQQERPNTYGCVRRGGIDLHFFSFKGFVPAENYSTCIVLVPDVDSLYAQFAAGMRQHYGKLLSAGIPRVTRPNNNNADGDRRFNVVDPGGNWVRFIQRGSGGSAREEDEQKSGARSVRAASFLVSSKGDFPGAAKILDTSLKRGELVEFPIQHVEALVLRAEVAVNLDDLDLARKLLAEAQGIALTDADRAALHDIFARAAEIAEML
jgi:catechol 2,3-dioxygenase-like lactoylglutathione lyase family enzyme